MKMTDTKRTDQLSDLLMRKQQLLMQLERLALRQAELVAGDDWTGLVKLLSAKQKLLATLRETEAALEPFRHDDPQSRVWRSDEARTLAARLVEGASEILTRVLRLEKDAEQELVRRRDLTATRLDQMDRASEARGAYAPKIPATFTSFNVVSER